MIGDPRLPDRFWAKVEVHDTCWLWTGWCVATGYGRFGPWGKSRLVSAHRTAYEALVGSIPTGLEIDHLCRVRNCVNPDHLEPVTRTENMRRSDLATGIRSARTHCPSGHPYDEANTVRYCGRRYCRSCLSGQRSPHLIGTRQT